jgi:hypothetical protein
MLLSAQEREESVDIVTELGLERGKAVRPALEDTVLEMFHKSIKHG